MPRRQSLSAIRAQIRALEKRAETIQASADRRITELAALIKRYGLSLGDWRRAVSLVGDGAGRGIGRGPRKVRRVPVKYADDKGNKWTGHGRPPLWLVAAEKACRKREDFLMKSAK
jgi:DNA-binding protein H-NS